MANPWVYGALERVPIDQKGGFRIPFTVIMNKSEVSAVYLCSQHDTSPHAPPFQTLRKLPSTAASVPLNLGIRSQQAEFIDEWKGSEVNRVATMFVEKITPAGRSVSTVTSLVVQYLSPQQTHNVLWRGEADNHPVGLLDEATTPTTLPSTTSNRNGILQPFSIADPHATGVSFTWKAVRPTTIVFPEPGSNEDGLVQWSITARRNTNLIKNPSVPPYLRGVTVDGERTQSEVYQLSTDEVARIQRAAEVLILSLSKESPLIKVHFLFRFTGGYLYFLHAPLLQRRGDVMDTKVRFVVPRQYLPNAGMGMKGRGGGTVGEEDLLETPRIEVAITLPYEKAATKKRLENSKRRKEEASHQNVGGKASYPALERRKQRAEEEKRMQNRVLASPCPDAPREHPEADPKQQTKIRQRHDVMMAKALLEALEGRKTIPLSKIAARLNLSSKQTQYLRQLRDDSETAMDVTVSRAFSLEYAQSLGPNPHKGRKPSVAPKAKLNMGGRVSTERQKRKDAQQFSNTSMDRSGKRSPSPTNNPSVPELQLHLESSTERLDHHGRDHHTTTVGPEPLSSSPVDVTALAAEQQQRPHALAQSVHSTASLLPQHTKPTLSPQEFIAACDDACVEYYTIRSDEGPLGGGGEDPHVVGGGEDICDTGVLFHYFCMYAGVPEYVVGTTTSSVDIEAVRAQWFAEVVPSGVRAHEQSKLLMYLLHSESLSGTKMGEVPARHQRIQRGDKSAITVPVFALMSSEEEGGGEEGPIGGSLVSYLRYHRTLRSFLSSTCVDEEGGWQHGAEEAFRAVVKEVDSTDTLVAVDAFPYEEATSVKGKPPGTPLFVVTSRLPPRNSIETALDGFALGTLRGAMVERLRHLLEGRGEEGIPSPPTIAISSEEGEQSVPNEEREEAADISEEEREEPEAIPEEEREEPEAIPDEEREEPGVADDHPPTASGNITDTANYEPSAPPTVSL